MVVEKKVTCNPHEIWKDVRNLTKSSQENLLGYVKNFLEVCFTDTGVKKDAVQKTGKTGKKKRRPSGYNLFIGNCMKPTLNYLGKPMKDCAADWKSADKETWNQKAKGEL